jgi:hypothetical protein
VNRIILGVRSKYFIIMGKDIILKNSYAVFVLLFCISKITFAQPTITTVIPAKNALNVVASSSIQITFSEGIDQGTFIVDSTINANGSQSGPHSGVITYNSGTVTATYNPTVDFKDGEIVTVTVTTGIKNGSAVAMANPYSWSFTVGSGTADSLTPKVNYITGDAPFSVITADLDGDGDLDLVTANYAADSISVLKNNGNGTFAQRVHYAVGVRPQTVASADLDGDGDMDLVTANINSHNISILKNNGDGTFTTKVDYPTGNNPDAAIVVDVDGDGDIDVVSSNFSPNTISVFKNNGDGTFAVKVDYATGTSPYSITSADLDGDGDIDIVTGNAISPSISVLKNNGNGSFTAPVNYTTGFLGSNSIAAADIDNDGDIDIITAHSSTRDISILKNSGTGVFDPSTPYGTGTNSYSVIAVDIDGDADIDVVLADYDLNTVSVLKNTNGGTFSGKTNYGTGNKPRSVTFADLDGDGDLDLAAANFLDDNISVFSNITAPVLPVELVSFSASVTLFNTALKWKTATEVNNYGFEIQRTIDNGQLKIPARPAGGDNWNTVGFVEGNGTTNTPKEYSFTDKGLQAGKYSYRLKQIDRDGKFEYSNEVEVTVADAPKEFALEQNYPNPFNPVTMINYQLPMNNHVILKVYDALGREVATLVNEMKKAGSYSAEFDASKLASGIYFYRLQAGEFVETKKMLLMK